MGWMDQGAQGLGPGPAVAAAMETLAAAAGRSLCCGGYREAKSGHNAAPAPLPSPEDYSSWYVQEPYAGIGQAALHAQGWQHWLHIL